jgi:hypothetical protein
MLNSVDEVVDAVGGTTAAAKLARVGLSAVSNWRANGKIPAEYFWLFEAELPGKMPAHLFGFKRETAV